MVSDTVREEDEMEDYVEICIRHVLVVFILLQSTSLIPTMMSPGKTVPNKGLSSFTSDTLAPCWE